MSETPKSAGPVAPELLADLAAASRVFLPRVVWLMALVMCRCAIRARPTGF
jgi:hypothetical protein